MDWITGTMVAAKGMLSTKALHTADSHRMMATITAVCPPLMRLIQSMSQSQGVDLSVLAWALSIGTDLGGSATPIGASANVVGTSVAAKNGHPVTWGTYCKYCAPATVLVITIAMVYLFVRYL